MKKYDVYEWHSGKHVCIHRGDCPYCNDGQGIHPGKTDVGHKWHGPFSTYQDALNAAKRLSSNARNCEYCHQAGRV